MKIERVNENQIRCTLTKQDLADRQLNLRELTYGSDKAKGLFHDMIQQANYEFGFEANDIPLMVEAIPLSTESLILLITKVEYPDELDTRFSKFTETDDDELFDDVDIRKATDPKGADDILGFFNKLREAQEAESQPQHVQDDGGMPQEAVQVLDDLTRMFEFAELDQVERLSRTLNGYYTGRNELYRDEQNSRYYLMVRKNDHTPEEFNRICNIICEYGQQKNYTSAVGAYFAEHGKHITGPWALQTLASL
jgi:adapter protein MecA 1/2